MTPEEHAEMSAELVGAWLAWDSACQRISSVAQAHADKQANKPLEARRPPPKPPAYALDSEGRRLVAAERALGMPLGWTDTVAALRQPRDGAAGMSAADAVETVVLGLTAGAMPAPADDYEEAS